MTTAEVFVVSAVRLTVKGEFLVLEGLLILGDCRSGEGGGDVNGVPSAMEKMYARL